MRRLHWIVLLTQLGCAGLSTNVTVPERKLPDAFGDSASGPSAAEVKWREWFADERLNALIGEALENNQDVLIAMQRIELARAGVRKSTGALLPQLALNIGGGVRKFGLYTMDGAGNATTDITPGQTVPVHLPDLAIGLQTSWEIDLWGKLRNQRESAVAQYLASIEGTHLMLTSLVADVATAYYELLALDRAREVLRQSAARQEEALEVVRLQKLVGRATELAVQQLAAQVADTRAKEREVLQQVVEAENRINVLLGRFPQPIPRDPSLLVGDLPRPISAGVPSELLVNRPDIREAELQVKASQFDLKAARAAFFPNITINAGVGFQAFNPAFLFKVPESIAYSVLGGLVAPLVNWTALQAEFSGAKATQIQAMYNYQKTILVGFVEVANGLSNIRNTEELLALRKTQKAALVESVEAADALYRAGRATYLDVLLAQENSLQADLALVEAQKRQRLTTVAVYKALGGGWR